VMLSSLRGSTIIGPSGRDVSHPPKGCETIIDTLRRDVELPSGLNNHRPFGSWCHAARRVAWQSKKQKFLWNFCFFEIFVFYSSANGQRIKSFLQTLVKALKNEKKSWPTIHVFFHFLMFQDHSESPNVSWTRSFFEKMFKPVFPRESLVVLEQQKIVGGRRLAPPVTNHVAKQRGS
jgi:hypothetical protein